MKKRLLSIVIVLAMVCLACTACTAVSPDQSQGAVSSESASGSSTSSASESAEAERTEKETYDIVFMPLNMATESQAFSAKMFEKHAADYGFNVTIMDSKGDPSVETQNIKTAIAQGADAIIDCTNDPLAIVPAMMEAKQAGVVVGMFSCDLDPDSQQYRDFYCGANDLEAGRMAGEAFIENFPDGATIVEVGGQAGNDAQVKRHDGFAEAIEGSNIEVIDSQNCAHWDANDAMNMMQDFIVKDGEKIQGIFCHWDIGYTGCIQAMTSANIDPSTVFSVAVDGCKSGYDQVEDGTQTISLAQNFETMAVDSMELCRKILDGQAVEPINYIEWEVISKDTIDSITRPEW